MDDNFPQAPFALCENDFCCYLILGVSTKVADSFANSCWNALIGSHPSEFTV